MRPLITMLLLFLLSGVAGAQETGSTTSNALHKEVEALLASMVTAFKSDPASVTRYYTDDAKIMGGGQRAEGREQVDQYWRGATVFSDWRLEALEVGGDGASPWVLGRSTLHSRSGRVMVTEFIGLLKRDRDGLKFRVDMYVAASPVSRRPGAAP